MAKTAKIPVANGDTSSPKKGAGGSTQKYKPSPQKTFPKKEGKKPKIINLIIQMAHAMVGFFPFLQCQGRAQEPL